MTFEGCNLFGSIQPLLALSGKLGHMHEYIFEGDTGAACLWWLVDSSGLASLLWHLLSQFSCYHHSSPLWCAISIRFGSKRVSGFRDFVLMSGCVFKVNFQTSPTNIHMSWSHLNPMHAVRKWSLSDSAFFYSCFIAELYLYTENNLNVEFNGQS